MMLMAFIVERAAMNSGVSGMPQSRSMHVRHSA